MNLALNYRKVNIYIYGAFTADVFLFYSENDRGRLKTIPLILSGFDWDDWDYNSAYPLVICYIAIENGNRNSWFSH